MPEFILASLFAAVIALQGWQLVEIVALKTEFSAIKAELKAKNIIASNP